MVGSGFLLAVEGEGELKKSRDRSTVVHGVSTASSLIDPSVLACLFSGSELEISISGGDDERPHSGDPDPLTFDYRTMKRKSRE